MIGDSVRLEVSLSPFDATWRDLAVAAQAAEELGISGIWMMDHLTGAVHDRAHVLECFSVLGGLAQVTEQSRLGTLVVNCGLRPPALLAQAAATVHHQSDGRFVLGLGAGGGEATPYAAEMAAAGIVDAPAAVRRGRVAETIGVLDHLWGDQPGRLTGDHYEIGPATGFLHPRPPPELLVGGFGPRMAALAGSHGAAFNTHARHPELSKLTAIVQGAAADARKPPVELTAFDLFDEAWLRADNPLRLGLAAAGVHTMIVVLAPPFDPGVLRAIAEAD